MADLLFLRKLALSPYFVNANLSKSNKMRVENLWNDLPWLYNIFQAGIIWMDLNTHNITILTT